MCASVGMQAPGTQTCCCLFCPAYNGLCMFAVVQAAECGHLTEGLALEWAMLCLRCGDAAGALAAARSAVGALPGSAAAWRQLITLQARQAAHAELANAEGSNGAAPPPGSDSGSSSSSEDEAEGQGPAGHSQRQRQQGRQLETLVLEAVRAVDVESAPPLWLTGLQALVGCGAPLDGLCRLLTEVVSGLARGPVEVSGAGMRHAAQQARVAWPRAPIPLRLLRQDCEGWAARLAPWMAPSVCASCHTSAGRHGRCGGCGAGGGGVHAGAGGGTPAVPRPAQAAAGGRRADARHPGHGTAGGGGRGQQ